MLYRIDVAKIAFDQKGSLYVPGMQRVNRGEKARKGFRSLAVLLSLHTTSRSPAVRTLRSIKDNKRTKVKRDKGTLTRAVKHIYLLLLEPTPLVL